MIANRPNIHAQRAASYGPRAGAHLEEGGAPCGSWPGHYRVTPSGAPHAAPFHKG